MLEFASVGWELRAPQISLLRHWWGCLSAALSSDWDWHVACFEWVGVALLFSMLVTLAASVSVTTLAVFLLPTFFSHSCVLNSHVDSLKLSLRLSPVAWCDGPWCVWCDGPRCVSVSYCSWLTLCHLLAGCRIAAFLTSLRVSFTSFCVVVFDLRNTAWCGSPCCRDWGKFLLLLVALSCCLLLSYSCCMSDCSSCFLFVVWRRRVECRCTCRFDLLGMAAGVRVPAVRTEVSFCCWWHCLASCHIAACLTARLVSFPTLFGVVFDCGVVGLTRVVS